MHTSIKEGQCTSKMSLKRQLGYNPIQEVAVTCQTGTKYNQEEAILHQQEILSNQWLLNTTKSSPTTTKLTQPITKFIVTVVVCGLFLALSRNSRTICLFNSMLDAEAGEAILLHLGHMVKSTSSLDLVTDTPELFLGFFAPATPSLDATRRVDIRTFEVRIFGCSLLARLRRKKNNRQWVSPMTGATCKTTNMNVAI